MSLDSILDHIINKAYSQRDEIIQNAKQEAEKLINAARQEAEKDYSDFLEKEKELLRLEQQRIIINSRIEAKKNLLKVKQELIDSVFKTIKSKLKIGQLKKQQILPDKVKEVSEDIDFFLSSLRQEHETTLAKILFSQ